MIWLIIIFVALGILIIVALNRNAHSNEVVAHQLYIKRQTESNPEYRKIYEKSIKWLEKTDIHLSILEEAVEIEENLAQEGLDKKEISELEKELKKIYQRLSEEAKRYFEENEKSRDLPILMEDDVIANTYREQGYRQDELSERSRQAKKDRKLIYPNL